MVHIRRMQQMKQWIDELVNHEGEEQNDSTPETYIPTDDYKVWLILFLHFLGTSRSI